MEDDSKLIAAGRSPLTLPVRQGGRIRIRAEATGFEPATKTVTISDDVDQEAVSLSLVPIAHPEPPHLTSAPQPNPAPVAKPAGKSPRSPTKPTDADDKIIE